MDDEDLAPVWDTAKDAIAFQLQVSERLDAKARGIVTIAAGWFAVVQAVAGPVLADRTLDRTWVDLTVALAAAATLGLLAATVLASRVWQLRRDHDIGPKGLLELHRDARTGALERNLMLHYAHTLDERAANNLETPRPRPGVVVVSGPRLVACSAPRAA